MEYKLIVSDGKEVIHSSNLSYEALASVLNSHPDTESSAELFEVMASHPASYVRETVAYKDRLNHSTVEKLANDSSINVLRNLARSAAFREHASQDTVERLLALDVEIAQNIANNLDGFEQCDIGKLATLLSEHQDLGVLAALAGTYNAPKKILKALAAHSDPYVAFQAKNTLG